MTEPSRARSALNLRRVLAVFGLVSCTALAVASFVLDQPVLGVVLVVLAVVALVDLVVIQRRAHREPPSEHQSLFE